MLCSGSDSVSRVTISVSLSGSTKVLLGQALVLTILIQLSYINIISCKLYLLQSNLNAPEVKCSDTEILASTKDFEDLIGKGGFRNVYKGLYHPIAVKVLHPVSMLRDWVQTFSH